MQFCFIKRDPLCVSMTCVSISAVSAHSSHGLLALSLWHALEATCPLILLRCYSLHLDNFRLVTTSAHHLISFGFESLRTLRLLDILFKLFVFLSSHLVYLLLSEL